MLTDGAVRQFSGREFQSLEAAKLRRSQKAVEILTAAVGSGEHYKLPAGSRAEPQAPRYFIQSKRKW